MSIILETGGHSTSVLCNLFSCRAFAVLYCTLELLLLLLWFFKETYYFWSGSPSCPYAGTLLGLRTITVFLGVRLSGFLAVRHWRRRNVPSRCVCRHLVGDFIDYTVRRNGRKRFPGPFYFIRGVCPPTPHTYTHTPYVNFNTNI